MSEFLNGFKRTHTCGALRGSDIGKTVRLVGWVQDYRNLGGFLFIVMRDRYGITQIHVDQASPLFDQASKIRAEWVIGVEGEVISRGTNINKKLPTGEIEVEAKELRIFNRAETTPFAIHDDVDASELLRLKYRYLVTELRKIARAGKPRGSRAYYGDLLSVRFYVNLRIGAVLAVIIGNEAFEPAYADALSLNTAHTFTLALCFLGTNSTANRGQGTGP